MRIICKIARTELQMLFYSPIAWLLLLCFIVQTALSFTYKYEVFFMDMESVGQTFMASSSLFIRTPGGGLGLWFLVLNFLYFYIPLLTMGSVSKDFSSGSIKLLYASPISNTQIILGKFLAMVIYAAILIAVLFIYVIIGWCTIEYFDVIWVLTGLLGLFLLTCTYMAVGIFVSSLTSYQIIAAVGTFVVLMLLSMVGGWGQQYDFVREITYWLSINGRAVSFIDGMICSEDLLYFPVITAMFLALTIIRLKAVRQKQKWTLVVGKNLIVVVIVCVVAYFSSQPTFTGYCDTTRFKENTLTPVSQEIIDQVDGGMTITSYVNVLDNKYFQYTYPNFIMANRQFFRHYMRFKPEIKLKVVYYYAESEYATLGNQFPHLDAWGKAKKICEMYGGDSTILKSKEEVDQMANLSEEGYRFVRQIVRDNGQKEWLRCYDIGFPNPTEAEISVALKRMVMTLPKIGFVTGHQERGMFDPSPAGYEFMTSNKRVQPSVWNQGFDVEEITLDKPVSGDISIMIIADPRVAFTPEEEAVLQEYLDRGGNLFILGEPHRRDVLNPMLRKLFGVELTPLLVKNDTWFKVLTPDVVACRVTDIAREKMYELRRTWGFPMPSTAGIEQVEDKGYKSFIIAKNDTLSPCWTELETTDFIDDTVRFNPAIGEVSKVFTTLLGLTREVGGKEQRIIVSGDTDVLSNNEFAMKRGADGLNQLLMLGASYWLSYEKAPLDVRRPMPIDNRVFLTTFSDKLIRGGTLWAFPLLVLGVAVYLWIRRRGR